MWYFPQVSEGIVAAYRPFRCPDRYLFDPITRLCQVGRLPFLPLGTNLLTPTFQREAKVECKASLFYSLNSRLAITLREEQLDTFFSTPLTLDKTKTGADATSLPSNIFPPTQFAPMQHFSTRTNLNPWLFSSRSWFPYGK